jgi:hypothetical protein
MPPAAGKLPTGLRYPRYQARRGEFPEGKTRKLKTTDKATPTPAGFAAVDNPHRTSIPRKLRQPRIVLLRLQLPTQSSKLLHSAFPPLVLLYPRLFRHTKGRKVVTGRIFATSFFRVPPPTARAHSESREVAGHASASSHGAYRNEICNRQTIRQPPDARRSSTHPRGFAWRRLRSDPIHLQNMLWM